MLVVRLAPAKQARVLSSGVALLRDLLHSTPRKYSHVFVWNLRNGMDPQATCIFVGIEDAVLEGTSAVAGAVHY